MVWHDREPDPMTDSAASAVLEAFEAAHEARLPPVFCYRAGVEAWRHEHPDQRPEYAARQATRTGSPPAKSKCSCCCHEA